VPRRYDLRLAPDLDTFVFTGSETITVDVGEAVAEIVLNAVDLEVVEAAVEVAGVRTVATVSLDGPAQQVRLGAALSPGEARIHLAFRGTINDRLHGFYRSTFEDVDGEDRTLAVTQFEATDARRAFPCFDEPDLKAVFSIALVVPPDVLALSNSGERERTPLPDGRIEVRFADTMPMSTYLVAFVVGPLEATAPVDVDGIPLRVVAPRGREHLTEFALEAGEACLRWLSGYYGIPYPGDKVDLVAIPDFAFGAMENLGCVTFRESALLVDRTSATSAELLRVLDVIAHELAHMWFGDLVTMRWWDGIWLNEAFASFMEMKATDAIRPDWKRWLAFAAGERPWAQSIDALTTTRPVEFDVRSPDEANEMFDALTYGKGSSILRMTEQFLGEEAFRRGVGTYLRTHAHGNTTTADLWAALDAASGLGVGTMLGTWIRRGGFPRVTATPARRGVRLEQARFLLTPGAVVDGTRWRIPVGLRGEIAGRPFSRTLVLAEEAADVDLGDTPDWVVANAGGHGFYRVAYSAGLRDRLVARLGSLDALERYGLVDDAWAFVEAGASPAVEAIGLLGAYRHETEHAVWQAVLAALGTLDHHVVTDAARPRFADLVADLIADAHARLGWEVRPEDDDLTRRLRGLILTAAGRLARLPDIVDRSRDVTETWLAGRGGDPEVTLASLFVASAHGDMGTYARLRAAREAATNPQDELRLLQAATAFDLPEAVDATLADVLDGSIRSQDAAWVLARLLGGRTTGSHAWRRVTESWEAVEAVLPPATLRRLVEGIPALSDPATAADVETFFATQELPGVAKILAQHLEILAVNVALRRRERDRFAAWLLA